MFVTRHLLILPNAQPEFDVAEEYLAVLYRQFIMWIGMTTFPLITVVTLFANLLELHRLTSLGLKEVVAHVTAPRRVVKDRYRLFRVCRRPPNTSDSLRRFLVFYLILIAIFAFASYPLRSTPSESVFMQKLIMLWICSAAKCGF